MLKANVTFVCDLMTITVTVLNPDINGSGMSVTLDDHYVGAIADDIVRDEYGFSPLKFAEDITIAYTAEADGDHVSIGKYYGGSDE